MVPYSAEAQILETSGALRVASFVSGPAPNADPATVASFGVEWTEFARFDEAEIEDSAADYFDVVPPEFLRQDIVALDLGCGSGRWAWYLARRVGFVEAVDPSDAGFAAGALNAEHTNVRVTRASMDDLPFPDES